MRNLAHWTRFLSIFSQLLFASSQQYWTSDVQAWIYPGNPACNAKTEYSDGRKIHGLKPEYFRVTSTGSVVVIDEYDVTESCNGYTENNANSIKQYSLEQYATIGGGGSNFHTLIGSSAIRSAGITTMVNFIVSIGFTGVEIDFEGFGDWTSTLYADYKTFVTEFGNALHANNKKLIIDGPPIFSAQSQKWYLWKYEDFNSLPVDYITVMAYDYMYDYGCGTAVQPLEWLQSICDWTILKITDINKIIIGIPSYGYYGTVDTYSPTISTKSQIKNRSGFSTAARDANSFEMKWVTNNVAQFYVDSSALNSKRLAIENKGIKHVSVWHLGGNEWFSGKSEVWPSAPATKASTSAPISATATKVSSTIAQTTKVSSTIAQAIATSQTPQTTAMASTSQIVVSATTSQLVDTPQTSEGVQPDTSTVPVSSERITLDEYPIGTSTDDLSTDVETSPLAFEQNLQSGLSDDSSDNNSALVIGLTVSLVAVTILAIVGAVLMYLRRSSKLPFQMLSFADLFSNKATKQESQV
jgi:spore germination protein YaaH